MKINVQINVLCGEKGGAWGGPAAEQWGGRKAPGPGQKRREATRPGPGALPHAPPIAPKWWPPEAGAIRGAITSGLWPAPPQGGVLAGRWPDV